MTLLLLVPGTTTSPGTSSGTGYVVPSQTEMHLVWGAIVVAAAIAVVVSARRRVRAWQIPAEEYRRRGLAFLPDAFREARSGDAVDLRTFIINQHVTVPEAERMIIFLVKDGLVRRIVNGNGLAQYALTGDGERAIPLPARSRPADSATGEGGRVPGSETHFYFNDYIAPGGLKQQGMHNSAHGWTVGPGEDMRAHLQQLVQALHLDADRAKTQADAQKLRKAASELDAAVQADDKVLIDRMIERAKNTAAAGQAVASVIAAFIKIGHGLWGGACRWPTRLCSVCRLHEVLHGGLDHAAVGGVRDPGEVAAALGAGKVPGASTLPSGGWHVVGSLRTALFCRRNGWLQLAIR